jgi:hypothetical protein
LKNTTCGSHVNYIKNIVSFMKNERLWFFSLICNMTDAQLYRELSSLPDSLKKEVADFIAFLKQKSQTKQKKVRTLGLAKGKIVIKDNFDDPIPGFEEYQ